MTADIKKIPLFITIFFLQSCSGGNIGTFLESSFENIEEEELIQSNLINEENNLLNAEIDLEENKNSFLSEDLSENVEQLSLKEDLEIEPIAKELIKVEDDESDFQSRSYRITLILKNVNPSSPTEILTKILRDFNLNFEIEKIERYSEKK